MTQFSTSLSSSLSHAIAASMHQRHCPPRPTHLPLLHWAHGIDHPESREWPDGSYSCAGYRWVIRTRKGPQEYWHLRGRDCRNTLTFAHTTSRILPTSDMSHGSPTVAVLEARDFVETLEPYLWMRQLCVLESDLGIILNTREVSKGNRGTKVINKLKWHEG